MEYEVDHLSASALKTYNECPRQYFYKYISDIEPPEEGEIEHFQIGNAVHDSIENILKSGQVLDLSKESLYSLFIEEEKELDYTYSDREKVETCLEFAAKFISKYVTRIESVEDKMTMDQNGISFTGYADLIADINLNGREYTDVIIDWKTGSENPEWKEKIQGGMYVKMFYEEFGRWPESIQFVYLDEDTLSMHDRVDDGKVIWNDNKNEYWDDIKSYISSITSDAYSGEFEAKPEDSKCHWCDFKYACSDSGIGGEEMEPQNVEIGGVI